MATTTILGWRAEGAIAAALRRRAARWRGSASRAGRGGWRALVAALGLLAAPGVVSAQGPPGVVEYYAVDTLGSVRVVFDAAGAVTARSDYLPFGEAIVASGNLPAQRFTGQARDSAEGMDHFNARNLLRTGRFNRVDPIGGKARLPQSWNRYAYVSNNPLRYVDPTGMYNTPSTGCDQASGAYWCPGAHMLGNVDDHFNPDMYGYQGGEELNAGELAYAAGEQSGAKTAPKTASPTTAPEGGLTVGLVSTGVKTTISVVGAVAEPTPLGELVLLAGLSEAFVLLKDAQTTNAKQQGSREFFFHYTNDLAARGIGLGGFILPSKDGNVYLTQDVYPSGQAAKAALNMSSTPTGFYIIPSTRVPGAEGPRPVVGGTGREWLFGGPVNVMLTPYIPLNPGR